LLNHKYTCGLSREDGAGLARGKHDLIPIREGGAGLARGINGLIPIPIPIPIPILVLEIIPIPNEACILLCAHLANRPR
jgi:hypothetical protein